MLSASFLRRRARTTARSNDIFMRGAKIVSPASLRQIGHHAGSAAVADDVDDHLFVLEPPE